ncbi:hypothetical protein FB45DRAFT_858663 [Roridomyces roridus]|uniref:Uncharacterized protein n=1 Tax=Roridomyces roridus TaxID=1738132 RepID=A0AAD7CK15_9AGAR|nr:hypothetical protein FB45DRAFT_858663 [Roridomyces roridus]
MPPAPDPGLSVFQDINEMHPGQTIRCHIDFLHSISSTPVLALVVEVQNDEGLLTVAPMIVEGKPPHPNLNDPAWQRMRSLTLGLLAFSSLPIRVPFQACSESMMFRSNETDEEMDENMLVYRVRRMAFQSGLDTTRASKKRLPASSSNSADTQGVESELVHRPPNDRLMHTAPVQTQATASNNINCSDPSRCEHIFPQNAQNQRRHGERQPRPKLRTSQQPPAAGSRIDSSHSPEPMAIDVSGQTFILQRPGLSAADVCMFDLSDAPRNSNDEKRELYGLPRRGISISDLIHPQNSQKRTRCICKGKGRTRLDLTDNEELISTDLILGRLPQNILSVQALVSTFQDTHQTKLQPMRPTYQPAPQKSPDFLVARGPPAAFL